MNPLSQFESLIAGILERPAWTLSARKLHPLELTSALTKALERRAVRLVDRVVTPDVYELRLNPSDLAAFGDARPVLERELGEYLRRTIVERDLSCNRPPSVRLLAAEEVRPGRVQVDARFTPPAEVAQPSNPRLDLIDAEGRTLQTFPLAELPATIGRRSDVGITLLSSKVSREHARIERSGRGYTIADLQSLNGTWVNGQQVRDVRPLHDGDLLEIGEYRLHFRQDGSRPFPAT